MTTGPAVYGLPGTADVLVYPANFVAKRWERREVKFLGGIARLDCRGRKQTGARTRVEIATEGLIQRPFATVIASRQNSVSKQSTWARIRDRRGRIWGT
jgi:hypothetical protein